MSENIMPSSAHGSLQCAELGLYVEGDGSEVTIVLPYGQICLVASEAQKLSRAIDAAIAKAEGSQDAR